MEMKRFNPGVFTVSAFENRYKNVLKRCLLANNLTDNRTGEPTYYSFAERIRIDLNKGFPILTGKKIFFDKAYHEFVWFINGDTNIEYLKANGINWWNEYADERGNLGPVYGKQLKNFGCINQLDYVIGEIKNRTRRAVVSLWNPPELPDMALPPCFFSFVFSQFDGKLNMDMTLRSSDLFLGLPYDIVMAALFLTYIAQRTDLDPNLININMVDAHIYKSHKPAVEEYLARPTYKLPTLKTGSGAPVLENYSHLGLIKAEMFN